MTMITQEAVTGRMVTGTSEIGSWDEVQSPSTKNIQGSLSIQKANRTTTSHQNSECNSTHLQNI